MSINSSSHPSQTPHQKDSLAVANINSLRRQIFERAPAEDIKLFSEENLEYATQLASHALQKYHDGNSVIDSDPVAPFEISGRKVTIITIVNDNMPFLFDSVLGELSDSGLEPLLIIHPILNGTGKTASTGSHTDAETKVSLIQIYLHHISEEQLSALLQRLHIVFNHVRSAVRDWQNMLAQVGTEISNLRAPSVPFSESVVSEAILFLEWLRDGNFTFLGMRFFRYQGDAKSGELIRSERPGLGILADETVHVLRQDDKAINTTPELRAFLHGPEPIIITKANTKSLVHDRVYLDYIGIKIFDDQSRLSGELRIVGLFTASAYTHSVFKIPYLRSKADAVIQYFDQLPADHSGKTLVNVLEAFPRDELFQISLPLLQSHAGAIVDLLERPRVRVLTRIDPFNRFVSIIVFVPRDRYGAKTRERIGDYLKTAFDGRLSAYYPAFYDRSLARVHFIIGRSGGQTPKINQEKLEAAVRTIITTWDDALRETADRENTDISIIKAATGFPESYKNNFGAEQALLDASQVIGLNSDNPIAIVFYRNADDDAQQARLKIYHYDTPVALSQRVPLLENMGFQVISERTFSLNCPDGSPAFLHDMELESAFVGDINLDDKGALFEESFLAVWRGQYDNDRLNALSQSTELTISDISVLRTYCRFLQQAGIAQSQSFIADTLNRYSAIAADLYKLFVVYFDPKHPKSSRKEKIAKVKAEIVTALENVSSLDDDTIIRRLVDLVEATLRTNFFVLGSGSETLSLALKIDSQSIEWLPQPHPWKEIFVYGPEVEGVHLRFGPIARGGLRLSDRAQDYRTEVLGLVKTQQVKNSVIVPVGAKGGFFPRQLPAGGDRQQVFEAGRQAYINFISSMLSITDTIEGDQVIMPASIVCHDGDDPYFVVAADKGTATFSDTANDISEAHHFWLDDAFASGGSAGYDHKKMAITARGAWESVKRHFRELDRDIQREPFTAVGVGDMSGDVFGNGMLRSKQTMLIAAFDHRDIFIDPTPDAALSFTERQRLFDLPRSSWQDYDPAKISTGGMIISRSQKQVTLTPQAAEAIGFDKLVASPTEIISAILKAPVDLLWFGGIGTYIRGSSESDLEVGDRANDTIRITGKEVRATVIGEGANLGMTQRARIDYQLAGGHSNTDAIDNSAGVSSSDIEVNIKIALAPAMRNGKLKREDRNHLLATMTDEVAKLVLGINYQQPLALSLVENRALTELPHLARMITSFENQGELDRAVEFLPSQETIAERQARGEALTRAETAVLLAYAKLVHFNEIVSTPLPDDPYFEAELFAYFPKAMEKDFANEISQHRLRREIITTTLINDLINRGGPAFITRLQDLTGQSIDAIAAAYVVVREGFGLTTLWDRIDQLDNLIDGKKQLALYQTVASLVLDATTWQLKNHTGTASIQERISQLSSGVERFIQTFKNDKPAFLKERLEERKAVLVTKGVDADLATDIALLDVFPLVPDIIDVSDHSQVDIKTAAHTFFSIGKMLRLDQLTTSSHAINTSDYYDSLAVSQALETIDIARRNLTIAALTEYGTEKDPAQAWAKHKGNALNLAQGRLTSLTESGDISVSRLSVAAGMLFDLSR